jgi:phenylalanyl-tRNA synthetase beta chain
VKRYVDQLTNGTAEYLPLDSNDYPVAAPFQKGRSAVVSIDGEVLGVIGEFRPQVQKAFKLPHASAGFELDTVLLHTMVQPPHYAPLSNFPSSSQDITLEVDEGVQWGAVQQLLKAELAVLGAELGYHVQLDAVSVYQDAVTKCRRFTFRVTVTHTDKTLTTSEVSSVLDAIAKGAHEKMAARRI